VTHILHEHRATLDVVACPRCLDGMVIDGPEAHRAGEVAWFTARHRPTETSCAAAEERAAGRKRA
jgi:hypothetical protein